MIDRIMWVDRKFDFDFPAALAAELLERLRGAPARLSERVEALPEELLKHRDGDTWSVQEHVGHLMDVEELFLGRLDDYDNGLPELRPAEMTGRKTFEANHNEADINAILIGLREERGKLVSRLDELDAFGFARVAFHPRLNKPMRVCDMMLFEATHDDYHMVDITRLIRKLA
jgi:uncharacterized damage-inducible protein DinB